MPQVDLPNVEPLLEQYEDRRANLIPILQDVQDIYRYLPQDVLRRIAKKLRVPLTEVYHVATFYRSFSLVPRGRHVIQVCLGTACHVRGAPRVLDRILRDLKLGAPGTTRDMQFTIETVRCIGCCGLAPVARVDNKHTHPHLTQAKVPGVLKKYADKTATQAPAAEETSHAKA
jgi:NADH:ubiquinone oxidoreductase subunit E